MGEKEGKVEIMKEMKRRNRSKNNGLILTKVNMRRKGRYGRKKKDETRENKRE